MGNRVKLALNGLRPNGHGRPLATNAPAVNRASGKVPAKTNGAGSGTLDKSPIVDAAAVKVARRSRFNPLRSLTPQLLSSALDAHANGQLRDADTLWREMADRDDVLKGVKPKREKAVTRRKWEVVMVDDSAAAKAQKAALEYFWNHATGVDAFDRNDRGGFSAIARFILLAQSYRYSALHLVWKPSPKGITAEFEWLPNAFFENISGSLRWLGPQGFGIEGTPLDPTNWLVCAGEGLMKPCSIAYGFKVLSYMDWISFNEKFGIPFIKATTNAAKDTEEWDNMVEMVEDFMNDGGGVFSEGSTVDLVSGGNAGSIPFPALIERCDRAMTALFLGSDLASMSRGGSGNSGASVQGGETVKIEADDCAWLSEQIQRVDKLVLDYTFGEDTEILASTQVRGPVTRDSTRDLLIDQFLINNGVPVSLADLAERYERSLPDEGEQLVKPPKPEPKSGSAADKQNDDDRDTAANERTADRADSSVRAAVNLDLQPLRDQVARALQGSDQDLQDWLAALDAMWPEVIEAVLKGDSAEKAIESVLGSAFVDGLDLSQVAANTIASNAGNSDGARKGWEKRRAGMMAKISGVVEAALDSGTTEAVLEEYHQVTADEGSRLKAATGLDVAGYQHSLDNYSVRHILKAHGSAQTEALRGQLPITHSDFANLPEIVTHWDKVESAGTTPQGRETIRYTKTIGDTLFLVEEVRTKRKRLVPVSLYKRRAAPDAAP